MNDQKEQQMWNMQLQIRLQELSRRAAHNLGRHLKMQQVTIIFMSVVKVNFSFY